MTSGKTKWQNLPPELVERLRQGRARNRAARKAETARRKRLGLGYRKFCPTCGQQLPDKPPKRQPSAKRSEAEVTSDGGQTSADADVSVDGKRGRAVQRSYETQSAADPRWQRGRDVSRGSEDEGSCPPKATRTIDTDPR
jgi:hypothetical protein